MVWIVLVSSIRSNLPFSVFHNIQQRITINKFIDITAYFLPALKENNVSIEL